ncbi:MAG: hypothetical protein VZR23_08070 [Lachnospiraceae bacterium]|nr:hypothetical protein [Lachnospiraceae bacterium]
MRINARYVEPAGYFPEEIRKEFKIGEYAEDDGDEEKENKKKNKKNTKVKHSETSDKSKP